MPELSAILQVLFSYLAFLILICWIFISQACGIALVALLSLLVFSAAWSLQEFKLLFNIFLFFAFGATSMFLKGKLIEESSREVVGLEQIQKDRNIIENGIKTHSQVKEALVKKLNRFSELKDMIGHLSSNLDFQKIGQIIVKNAYKTIGKSSETLLYLVDPQKQELALIASEKDEDFVSIKAKKGDIFDSWVLKQRQPLIIEDVKKDYRFDVAKTDIDTEKLGSLICAPLISKEKVLGILRLNSQATASYLQEDLRLLYIMSNLAAVAVENTTLYRRTEELSIIDDLTGTYVQRYFKERLAFDVTRCMRSDSYLSVLMLDIDYFKAYNDKYGHSAGDIVLRKVADILSETVADTGDMVARYGGEEFAIVLIEKNKQQALEFAQEVRKKIEQESIVLRREKTKVTVSMGIASLPEDAKVGEDLIKIADDMLYKAKKEGRNKVCLLS